MEEWKVVKEFPNYEVSSLGRVRSSRTKTLRHAYIGNNGYPVFKFIKDGHRYSKQLHRIVATEFIDNPMNYPIINHIDGNKENNSIDNLEWCTYSHNNQHAYDMGLKKFYAYKVEPTEYKTLYNLYIGKVSVKVIARIYGVTENGIYKILRMVKQNDKYKEIREGNCINKAI